MYRALGEALEECANDDSYSIAVLTGKIINHVTWKEHRYTFSDEYWQKINKWTLHNVSVSRFWTKLQCHTVDCSKWKFQENSEMLCTVHSG